MARRLRHRFGESGFCSRCGAELADAQIYEIGCEAGPDGNEPGYRGFALTPAEQAAGVTVQQKAEAYAREHQR